MLSNFVDGVPFVYDFFDFDSIAPRDLCNMLWYIFYILCFLLVGVWGDDAQGSKCRFELAAEIDGNGGDGWRVLLGTHCNQYSLKR